MLLSGAISIDHSGLSHPRRLPLSRSVPAMKKEKKERPAQCFSAVQSPSTTAGSAIHAACHCLDRCRLLPALMHSSAKSTRPTAWTPGKVRGSKHERTAARSGDVHS